MGTERPHERIAPRCVEFDDREGMSARFRGAQPIADPAPISAHRVFATSKPTRFRASTRASPSVISPTSEPSASRRTIFAPPVACARGESVSQRLATACTVTEGPTQLLVRRNPATSALSPSGATSTGMRTAFAPRFSRRALIGSGERTCATGWPTSATKRSIWRGAQRRRNSVRRASAKFSSVARRWMPALFTRISMGRCRTPPPCRRRQ